LSSYIVLLETGVQKDFVRLEGWVRHLLSVSDCIRVSDKVCAMLPWSTVARIVGEANKARIREKKEKSTKTAKTNLAEVVGAGSSILSGAQVEWTVRHQQCC
jgi:ethanolamine utilization protein EutA (predicted chaperonin)